MTIGNSSKKLTIRAIENDGSISDLLSLTTKKSKNLIYALHELKKSSKEINIKIYIGEEEFEVTSIQHNLKHSLDKILKDNLRKYNSLSDKERTILCFLYRGYKQPQIAASLNISINTYRQHRKKLYRKMEFDTKFKLNNWCDKYLSHFFKNKVSSFLWLPLSFWINFISSELFPWIGFSFEL